MITELEAKRRAAQRKLDQAQAPLRQAELAAQELADLEQQIAAAQAVAAAEARDRQQHLNNVNAARLEYEATPPALVEQIHKLYLARLRLVDLGEPDPGDRVLSVEAIAAPMVERDRQAAAITAEMFNRDRATPEQETAARQRQNLIDQLHIIAHPWHEAEQLADAVLSGELTLEQALSSAGKANEHEYAI